MTLLFGFRWSVHPCVIVLGLAASCGGAAATRSTTAPTPIDGTEPASRAEIATSAAPPGSVEVPSLGFRLVPPEGRGWVLLDAESAAAFSADADAGMMNTDLRLYLAVSVEDAPASDVDTYAEAIVAMLPTESTELFRRALLFRGVDARLLVHESRSEGAPVRSAHLAFLHGGRAYNLTVWGNGLGARGDEMLLLARSFELIPVVAAESVRLARVDAQAARGWRYRDRVLETVPSGFRVEMGDDWEPILGGALPQFHVDAEIGLQRVSPDMWITVIGERVEPEAQGAYVDIVQGQMVASGAVERPGTIEIEWAGRPMTLRRFEVRGFELDHGTACFGSNRCVQVMVTYGGAHEEAAREVLVHGLPRFTLLDEVARRALDRELQHGSHDGAVGPGYALRDGLFVHFTEGMRVAVPPGVWQFQTGDGARDEVESAIFMASETREGFFVTVEVTNLEGDESPADAHERYLENIGLESTAPPQPMRVGTTTALVSEGDHATSLGTRRIRCISAAVGRRSYILTLEGHSDAFGANGLAAGVTSGFAIGTPIVETVQSTTGFVDRRFGYAIDLPGSPWTFTDGTSPATRGIVTSRTWRRGESALSVTAIARADLSSPALRDLVLRGLHQRFGAQWVMSAPVSATLGGRPAEEIEWPQGGAIFAMSAGVVYMLIHSKVSNAELDEILSRFRVLEGRELLEAAARMGASP